MDETQTTASESEFHIVKVDGATYIVKAYYVGKITFLELLKQMIKRVIERMEYE